MDNISQKEGDLWVLWTSWPIGTFRPTFTSKSVLKEEDFKPSECISRTQILFTPTQEFRQLKGIEFFRVAPQEKVKGKKKPKENKKENEESGPQIGWKPFNPERRKPRALARGFLFLCNTLSSYDNRAEPISQNSAILILTIGTKDKNLAPVRQFWTEAHPFIVR